MPKFTFHAISENNLEARSLVVLLVPVSSLSDLTESEKDHRSAKWYFPVGIMLYCLMLTPVLVRAEWSWQPTFGIGQEYNDNFNLNDESLSVWRSNFSMNMNSSIITDRWDTLLIGLYSGSRILNISDSERDQDAISLNLSTQRSSDNHGLGMNVGINYDQPSSSQVESGNQIFNRVTRIQWHGGPFWDWQWNEYTHLRLGYNYESVSFEDKPESTFASFTKFNVHTISFGVTNAFYDDTQLSIQSLYIINTNDELGFTTEQFIAQPGLTYIFSENLQLSLVAGAIILRSERRTFFGTLRDTQVGPLFNVSAQYDREFTTLSASFDFSLAPTINGGQVESTRALLAANHNLIEELSANLALSVSQSETIQSTLSQQGQRNFSVETGLSWNLFEHTTLNASYRFELQERDGTRFGSATRNTIAVSLNYNGSPFFIYD